MSFLKLCLKQMYSQQLPSPHESKIIQVTNLTHMLTQMQKFKICMNPSPAKARETILSSPYLQLYLPSFWVFS